MGPPWIGKVYDLKGVFSTPGKQKISPL